MRRFLSTKAPILVVVLLVIAGWGYGEYWGGVLRDAVEGIAGTLNSLGENVGSALRGLEK